MDIPSSAQRAAQDLKNKLDPEAKLGRPRDPAKEDIVLAAALQLLKDVGFGKFSLSKVAALSGVARPTIRLRWQSKEALSIATVQKLFDNRSVTHELAEKPSEGLTSDIPCDARESIRKALTELIAMISEPGITKVLSSLVAAANYSEPLGELRQYILNRRGIELRGLLEMGIASGQFPPDLDVERTLDALNGPVLYRMLVMNLPMGAGDADFIVDMVLPVYTPRVAGKTVK